MAQRKPMLDFISEGDWRLADERQRLLAHLQKAPLFLMINEQNPAYFLKVKE